MLYIGHVGEFFKKKTNFLLYLSIKLFNKDYIIKVSCINYSGIDMNKQDTLCKGLIK